MQIDRQKLINELFLSTEKTNEHIQFFKSLNNAQLNFKKDEQTWSILECVEHLNLYGEFYLPEIEKQLLKNKPSASATIFNSGVIGNYFANLMRGKNGKINKMKTFKSKNPNHSKLNITTLDRFLKQQERLKQLLLQSQEMDLTQIKTAITLSKYLTLRLGDTFRFVVYHIERHIQQANRIIEKA